MRMRTSTTKNRLAGSTAFIRPTELERSFGRLMRSPEGHDAAPAAPAPAADPAPAPADAPDATALGGGADPAPDPAPAPADVDPAPDVDAPKDPAEAAPVVPEAYELVAPDGLTLDAAAIEAATPVFKELGLSNEAANKLIPVAAQFAQGIQDKMNQEIISQVTAERKAWLDTAKADPEIGGANWAKTLTEGASALDALGLVKGSPFRVLLDESGLGNHPEMIRAFAKVGQAIGEDGTFTRSDRGGGPKADTATILYPDDQPKQGA